MQKSYWYPGTNVLINKFNIKEFRLLQLQESSIEGDFSMNYLRQIHKYIFHDIYDWAGQIRNVNIGKGNLFCLAQYINSEA